VRQACLESTSTSHSPPAVTVRCVRVCGVPWLPTHADAAAGERRQGPRLRRARFGRFMLVVCRVVARRGLPCSAMPCRALSCRAVPCRAMPCRALSSPATAAVPEALGIVPGTVFVLCVLVLEAVGIGGDSSALATITFMLLLGPSLLQSGSSQPPSSLSLGVAVCVAVLPPTEIPTANTVPCTGFIDDVLGLRWRHKMLLPCIASLPLALACVSRSPFIDQWDAPALHRVPAPRPSVRLSLPFY
jgi:hypothetical protein